MCTFATNYLLFRTMTKCFMRIGRTSFTLMVLLMAGGMQAQDRLYADEFP